MFSSLVQAIFGGQEEAGLEKQIPEQRLDFIVDNSQEPPQRYIKAEWLGKGGFATCYRVIEVSPEKLQYACKIISKADFENKDPRHVENRKTKLEREVRIQMAMAHEHLVRLVHFFEDETNIYLIMDLCPNQSLHDLA